MRCPACDYRLWNLRPGPCPECGTPFRPSQFRFTPGAVRFCCPHCDQAYYGTDENGLIVPRSFTCVRCARALDLDDLTLSPAEGVSDDDTDAADMPWLRPAGRSRVRRWFDTVTMSMLRPGELMDGREDASSLRAAWGFALVNLAVVASVGLAIMLLFFALIVAVGGGGRSLAPLGPIVFAQAVLIGVMIVLTVALTAMWALATRGLLRVTGRGVHGTLRTTFHAILYSTGPMVLSIIPCASNVAPFWWAVSAILMVRRGHRVSGVRASLCTLAFPVMAVLAFFGAYAALFAAVINAAASASTIPVPTVTPGDPGHAEVHRAILDRARDAGGWTHADHGALLVTRGYLPAGGLVAGGTLTTPAGVPVADTTLFALAEVDAAMLPTIEAALDPLPPDVVAHRVGDFVFTYHGIDATNPAPDLWLAVASPDPDTNAPPSPNDVALVPIIASGPQGFVTAGSVWSALGTQNAARAAHGLPPLPEPATVTHARPARASDGPP